MRSTTTLILLIFILIASGLSQISTHTIPKHYFGIHSNTYSVWPEFLGALGKGTLTNWQYSEPKRGVYDWTRLDRWVAAAQKHGVTLVYANGGIPKWAVDPAAYSQCKPASQGSHIETCKAMVMDIADWEHFVRAVATRYKGKLIYELWNEPGGNGQYLTVADMVTLTRREYDIIRSVDPDATILCCAFRSYGNYAFMDKYFAAGGVTEVDGISFHGIFQDPSRPPEGIVDDVRTVRSLMNKYGIGNKPLWDSEGGWAVSQTPPESEKPSWLAKWYLLQYSEGVERSYWYGWNNWRPLWHPDTGVNPTGIAYKEIAAWLIGGTMKPCTADHGTWTCAISRPNGYLAEVVWSASGSSSFTASTVYSQYRTLAGKTIQIIPGKQITITRTPILLETFTP
jgi:hypothetical protein